MAINQLTTANTFEEWLIATSSLIAVANNLTDNTYGGFLANSSIFIQGSESSLNVRTLANINLVRANVANIANVDLSSSNISIPLDLVVGNSLTTNTLYTSGVFVSGLTIVPSSVFDQANGAFAQANVALTQSNAAFLRANNSLSANVGGTVTGNLVISESNLVVSNGATEVFNVSSWGSGISATSNSTGTIDILGGFGVSGNVYADQVNDNGLRVLIQANAAFAQANISLIQANAAFAQANITLIQANAAFLRANNSMNANIGGTVTGNLVVSGSNLVVSNGATEIFNVRSHSTTGLPATSNVTGTITVTGGIGIKGNIWTDQIYDNGLRVLIQANAAFAQANIALIQANSAFAQANLVAAQTIVAFTQANAAFLRANNSMNANVGGTITGNVVVAERNLVVSNAATEVFNVRSHSATGLPSTSNVTGTVLISGGIGIKGEIWTNQIYDNGLRILVQTNAAFAQANVTLIQANAAFAQANLVAAQTIVAFTQANAAFLRANNSLSANVGGTITGNLVIAERNLVVSNAATEVFNVRSHSATGLPATSNVTGTVLISGGIGVRGEIYADQVYDNGLRVLIQANAAFAQANVTLIQANAAFAQSNVLFTQANAAFLRANNSMNANIGGTVTGNLVISGSNLVVSNGATEVFNVRSHSVGGSLSTSNSTGTVTILGGIGVAGNVYTEGIFDNNFRIIIQADAAFAQANVTLTQANAAFAQSNITLTQANAAFAQANVALTQANAAFIIANLAFGAAFSQANAAFIRANNSLNANLGGTVTADVTVRANAWVASNISLAFTPDKSSGAPYNGTVLGQNGNIHLVPGNANRGQSINVISGVVSTYSLPFTSTSFARPAWYGGTLAPNGDIHFAPHISPFTSAGEYAPIGLKVSSAGIASTYTMPTYSIGLAGGYAGGVLNADGTEIHFIPYFSANQVGLKVSTTTNAVSTYSLVYTLATYMNLGGVLATNGDIHFVPYSANRGQKISSAGVVSTYSLVYTGSGAYAGGVLASNGDIHFVPYSANRGQKISSAGVVSTYSLVYTTGGAYHWGVLAPNGDIHFVPYYATVGQKISPAGVVSTYSLNLSRLNQSGGKLNGNGVYSDYLGGAFYDGAFYFAPQNQGSSLDASVAVKIAPPNPVRAEQASGQDAIVINGSSNGTGSFAVTLTPETLTTNRTVTIPNEDFTAGFRNVPVGANTFYSSIGIASTYTVNALSGSDSGAYGGVLSSNGEIHLVPYTANRGQKISAAGVVSTYSLVYTVGSAYRGGVLAPNGDIHFVPYSANRGQKISSAGVVSTYSLVYTGSGAYDGGVLAQNGDIHFVPYSANRGQKISSAGVVSTYSLVFTSNQLYSGGVLAPNGDVYFVPYGAGSGTTVGQKVSAVGVVSTFTLFNTSSYSGGVLAPNGDTHFVPLYATIGQKVSAAGVVSTYSLVYTAAGAYSGGVLAPNGDIHFVPYQALTGQKINKSGVVSSYGLIYTYASAYPASIGGVVSANGTIYFIPNLGTGAQRIANTYTLSTDDVGKQVQLFNFAEINIPTSTFSDGDTITLVNSSSANINLIFASALTSYISGINTDINYARLPVRGVATIMFISPTICVSSGNFTAYG